MGAPRGEQVASAMQAVLDALEPLTDRDWNARAGDLEWTCHQTAIHLASDLIRYAAQLAGATDEAYLRFGLAVSDQEPPAELLRILHGCGLALAAVVDRTPADATAWHWGPTDASGFAAMGMGELLVHAYDIAQGLDHDWSPPSDLARVVVERLFAGTVMADDPSVVLLWSTGRIDVDGRDHVDQWVWRAASA
jgi:hypothetical protein